MERRSSRLVALLLLAAGGSSPAAAQNLIANGDFEAGNTGFTSNLAFTSGNTISDAQYMLMMYSTPHVRRKGRPGPFRRFTHCPVPP